MLGLDIGRIEDVIITHMHFDHCGNHHLFPVAKFHVQDAEMVYATGRCMCHRPLAHTFEVDDVCAMVRRLFDGDLQSTTRSMNWLLGYRSTISADIRCLVRGQRGADRRNAVIAISAALFDGSPTPN
ncbi:MBL fold metallo-hydrolase [Rhizobium leguminosarum]|uniref:MBL fold metallo-hydrolase n=1 Tax=Rhizobium leguminosarum TaxID=384 RepID=UPI00198095CE